MLRKWGTLVVAAAFVASSTAAVAGTDASQGKQQGALAPGKAAGVEQAEKEGCCSTVLLVTGGALIAGGLALALSGSSNGSSAATTTSTTTTTTH